MTDDTERARAAAAKRLAQIAALVKRDSKLDDEEVTLLHDVVFPHLYATHYTPVLNWFRKQPLLSDWDVEDLHQESLLSLYNKLCDEGFPDSIGAMLHEIAHGHYLNWLRARRRSPVSLGLPSSRSERPPSGPTAERIVAAMELGDQLISELEPEYQAVVELVFVSELSHKEAALVLDIPVGTLKTHVLKLRERVAEIAERLLSPNPRGRS